MRANIIELYIYTTLHSRINVYIKKIIQLYFTCIFIREMQLDLYAYVYMAMQVVWIYP